MADFRPADDRLGRTHAHSTVRVSISACFIFGCLLTFHGSLRVCSRTMMFRIPLWRKYNAGAAACQAPNDAVRGKQRGVTIAHDSMMDP